MNLFDEARIRLQKPPDPNMHSEIHSLVNEARRQFGETAKRGVGSFGFYLGFFKRMGAQRVRQLLAESRDATNPKKAFWWQVGKMSREKNNPQSTH